MLPPLSPSLVRNVIYPIYRALRGDRLLSILEELERTERLPADEIEEIQWRRITKLLEYAGTNVPYYRSILAEAGIAPGDIRTPDDLRSIPFLTKEIVREQSRRLVTRDPSRRGYPSSTGGSTGEPLFFFNDAHASPTRRANTIRGYRWANIDIGDRQAILWGFALDRPLKKRIAESVKNYFNNILTLSTFDMSEDALDRYAARLRLYRPDYVVGYPSALTIFAEHCRRENARLPRVKAIVSSGERIFPHQREILEDIFSCPVYDRYGSREFAAVAHECGEHRGLHVFSDLCYVEIVDENGAAAKNGEVGELVVTDLLNYYMPFIRYRTGDLASWSERTCPCGRGFPLIESVEGRSFDAIVTPAGKRIGGFFWTWLSRAVPGIERFQVEQRGRSGVTFRIVPGRLWRDEYRDTIGEKIREQCGKNFRVDIAIVDEIPLTPSGKSRFIISRREERLVLKSKIHKATITGEDPDGFDQLVIDEELMERANLAPLEQVLIVDNTNGARVETVVGRGERGSGRITIGGAAAMHVHEGDEVSIMAFTWSDDTGGGFRNLLVDEDNRFVRYLTERAGETT